jgi:hypothetical protein
LGELVIVTGPPGAGKSATSAVLADTFDCSVLIPADWFFGLWRGGAIDPWLPEAAGQTAVAGEAAARTAGVFARSADWVVYDGFVLPRHLSGFVSFAAVTAVHYAVLLPPVKTCLARVASRTGHGFSDEAATQTMYSDFADADVPSRHLITGAESAPDSVADEVRTRLTAGELVWASAPRRGTG